MVEAVQERTGSRAGTDARPPGDGRASLWHDQILDGIDALPDPGLPSVSTEMSLHVLAYNLKRMMNIFGVKPLIEAIQA